MLVSILLLTLQTTPGYVPATWLRLPESDPSERAVFADFIGVSGPVEVSCKVPPSGVPEACRAEADPEGLGLERVALAAMRSARFTPATQDGHPVESDVVFLFRNTPAKLPPPEGPAPTAEALVLATRIANRMSDRIEQSGRLVADVAADRRDIVQDWIDEVLPFDRQALVDRIAGRFARVLTIDQLRNLDAGLPPGGEWPSWERFNGADYRDVRQADAGAELRRRYCSAYDCDAAD